MDAIGISIPKDKMRRNGGNWDIYTKRQDAVIIAAMMAIGMSIPKDKMQLL